MKTLLAATLLFTISCGSKGGTTPVGNDGNGGSGGGVVQDTRTPYMKRRGDACEKVAPKITACAVEDAKAELAAGKTTQAQFDKDIAPEVQKKNSAKFVEECAVPGTTYQLRVLEVCEKEESECGPLLDCLSHLNDKK